jgi:hypothetical protein
MEILNLTQHQATPDQAAAGVCEPVDKQQVSDLLTFDQLPDETELANRGNQLAGIAVAEHYERAMIGGAPFFMSTLEKALLSAGIEPLYSFSARRSEETADPVTGETHKSTVFKHLGFISIKSA